MIPKNIETGTSPMKTCLLFGQNQQNQKIVPNGHRNSIPKHKHLSIIFLYVSIFPVLLKINSIQFLNRFSR